MSDTNALEKIRDGVRFKFTFIDSRYGRNLRVAAFSGGERKDLLYTFELVSMLKSAILFAYETVGEPEVHLLDPKWEKGAYSVEFEIAFSEEEFRVRQKMEESGFEEDGIQAYRFMTTRHEVHMIAA